MQIADIEKEIARIEKLQFMNAMNDHWSQSDYEYDSKCNERIRELKAQLEVLRKNE